MAEILYSWDIGAVPNTITATLDDTGLMNVIGKGYIMNSQTPPFEEHKQEIKNLVIHEGITRVGDYVFRNCFSLKTVRFPSTLQQLGIMCFGSNSLLQELTFLGNAPYFEMGISPFEYDSFNIKYNTLMSGWEDEISNPKYGGSSLSSWEGISYRIFDCGIIPFTVSFIFNTATHGAEIDGYGDMYDYISGGTPWHEYLNNISSIIISNGITSIGEYCFAGIPITDITIPNSVVNINRHSFDGCNHLVNVELSGSLQTIGDYAFANTAIKEITIPYEVVNLGHCIFDNCSELKEITVRCNPPEIQSDTFENLTLIIYYDSENHYWTPEIRTQTYAGASYVVWNELRGISWECGAVEGTVTATLNLKTKTLTISGNGNIADYSENTYPWYSERKSISHVIINNGINRIGHYCFYDCTYILDVTIPKTIISIGNNAFKGCERLNRVNFFCNPPLLGIKPFDELEGITIQYDQLLETWTDDIRTNEYGGATGCMWVIPDKVLLSLSGLGHFYNKLKVNITDRLSEKADKTIASATNVGLMSPSDKIKLDTIAPGGNAVSWHTTTPRGTIIGILTIDGVPNTLYYDTTNLDYVVISNETIDDICR